MVYAIWRSVIGHPRISDDLPYTTSFFVPWRENTDLGSRPPMKIFDPSPPLCHAPKTGRKGGSELFPLGAGIFRRRVYLAKRKRLHCLDGRTR